MEGLAAARSRSRENNTQLFSNTLAPLRYLECWYSLRTMCLPLGMTDVDTRLQVADNICMAGRLGQNALVRRR